MDSKTIKNLMASFAGESQAYQRYLMYAKIAKKEGYTSISNIFEETAINEQQHAKEFYKLMCSILGEENMPEKVGIEEQYPIAKKSTLDNLMYAAGGESEEVGDYNEFAKIAKEEGYSKVAIKFELIANIEAFHSQRYAELAKKLQADKLYEQEIEVSWKCEKCGHIHTAKIAPGICPVCSHDKSYFKVM